MNEKSIATALLRLKTIEDALKMAERSLKEINTKESKRHQKQLKEVIKYFSNIKSEFFKNAELPTNSVDKHV